MGNISRDSGTRWPCAFAILVCSPRGRGQSGLWHHGLFCRGALCLVYLYAVFDRWAEHQSQGTPLARTIPTLLAIALLYEVFPLDHFHIFLPLTAILIALMADWSAFHLHFRTPEEQPNPVTEVQPEEQEENANNV